MCDAYAPRRGCRKVTRSSDLRPGGSTRPPLSIRCGNGARTAIEHVAFLVATTFVVGSFATSAMADDDFDPEKRWTPAVAFQMDVLGTTGKGRTNGSEISGPRVANAGPRFFDVPTNEVVLPARSREQVVTGLIGGDFELMTPRLASPDRAPRLFLNVNVAAALGPEVGLARDGDPGPMALPQGIGDSSSLPVGETAITGAGTKMTVQYQGPQIHAGLGAAFLFDLEGHRFRVKPSVVYSRLPFDVYGVLRRAVRLNGNTGPARTFDNTYRTIELSAKQREIYHGAGAALEVEYETGDRLGPFTWSIFLKGQATRLFGDLETNLSESNPEYPDEQVFFTYKHDRWFYRLGTGIRIRLDGKERRSRR